MCGKINPETLHFRPITERDFDSCQGFSCNNTSMDSFLKQEAYFRHISREASTTLFFIGEELVGYFTLCHKKIQLDEDDSGMPNDDSLKHRDSLDIARIAISETRQNLGIGEVALRLIIQLAYIINERYITLDALFEKRNWYRKLGFKPAIQEEYQKENELSLVYMYLDVYDPKLLDDYFENP